MEKKNEEQSFYKNTSGELSTKPAANLSASDLTSEYITQGKTSPLFDESESQFLQEGTVLQGKYRINRVLGQGGFGITYEGTDLKLQRKIAIKEYFPMHVADRASGHTKNVTCNTSLRSMYEQGIRNFLKEARNMAKFAGQDNFISVHDIFTENNTAYIIMEYVDGRNLKSHMRQHGRFTMEAAMAIISPVMDALEKIHDAGLIHRDISPTNIMVLPNGNVKLLDFGAVMDITPETMTLSTMSAVYKKGYSPIEQQTPDMHQGTYTDIYALCATLYEMLTGSVPPAPFARLTGDEKLIPPSSQGVKISDSQEKGLLKGLEIYGKDRTQTIKELRSALFNKDIGIIHTGDKINVLPPEKNNKKYVMFAAAAVLILVFWIAIKLLTPDPVPTPPGPSDTGSVADSAGSKEETDPDDSSAAETDAGGETNDVRQEDTGDPSEAASDRQDTEDPSETTSDRQDAAEQPQETVEGQSPVDQQAAAEEDLSAYGQEDVTEESTESAVEPSPFESKINHSQVEDYSLNLEPQYYYRYTSDTPGFSFRYPNNLYNSVYSDFDQYPDEIGNHLETHTFRGSGGSALIFSLYERNDGNGLMQEIKKVTELEGREIVDSFKMLKSYEEENGKIRSVITGYNSYGNILYVFTMVDDSHIMKLHIECPPYAGEEDEMMKRYVQECIYRYCGFKESKVKEPRSYREFLESDDK